MTFQRPTLQDLIARTDAAFATRFSIGPLLRRSVLGVISRVLAGASHLLHGHLDWISRQVFVQSAESAELARHAATWGLARKAATFAGGNVTFTGTNGATVPAGTLLRRSDGAEYTTDAQGTISGGSATVAATASLAGELGNTDAGIQLSLPTPVAGVQSKATVAAGGLTGGADQESDELLRGRLLQRIQEPPHGGAEADYVAWALEVPEVTRAWVYPVQYGAGTVGVTFVVDDDPGGPIPDGAKVTEVTDYLEERRPVTAALTVFAPTAVPRNFTITLTPGTDAVKAAVTAALADLIRREGEPGGTLLLSHLREAISTAAGEEDHVLVSPAANVTHTFGQLPTMGTVTWS